MNKLFKTHIAVMGIVSSSFALFINGGFEDGTFNGWNLSYGYNNGGVISWTSGSNGLNAMISDASPMLAGQTLDINPYNGNYMACLDDLAGNYHASKLSQTDVITAADFSETMYVNWGTLLVEPQNTHPASECPYFGVSVLKNGAVVNSFTANATNHSSDPSWALAGNYDGDAWYKSGTWSYDLSAGGFSVGDIVTVELYVADCSWGGHGGAAFLDGIGTVFQPPQNVPEPTVLLFLGTSLLGFVGYSFSKRK
jgi:hypothetical protein